MPAPLSLLVGLYVPEEGSILLNGEPVGPANRDRYRQSLSAILSDFHLFDRLLDAPIGHRCLHHAQLVPRPAQAPGAGPCW